MDTFAEPHFVHWGCLHILHSRHCLHILCHLLQNCRGEPTEETKENARTNYGNLDRIHDLFSSEHSLKELICSTTSEQVEVMIGFVLFCIYYIV
jgi:hypothetical protein